MSGLVEDAILFFKMVGGSDELSNKGFSTAEVMPLDYCNKIVELANKYGVECDDTMPYGVLDAEYDLEKFFKSKLEESVKGDDLNV